MVTEEPREGAIPLKQLESATPSGRLTHRQIKRIERYKAVLAEVEPSSLEETLDSFRRDRNPDAEISVWEQVAGVYAAELKLRPTADWKERDLLFKVILQCSLSAGLSDVAAGVPMAADLPQLGRVVQRFQLGLPD